MMSRGTEVSDYLPFLADLSENNKQYFLEGGQAVNFWAEYLSAKGRCEGISDFKPFTSKDCDIWIDLSTLNYLGTKKNGHLLKGKSPENGQVGIFTTNESPARIIDLIDRRLWDSRETSQTTIDANAAITRHTSSRSSSSLQEQEPLLGGVESNW